MRTLAQLAAAGRAAGAAGTFVVRQAVFGTRPIAGLAANIRPPRKPVAGVGLGSVYAGPLQAAARGAPVLRRW